MRLVSIGECMAELSPSDVEGDYHLGFAGDTFNTAWYLARLQPEIDISFFTTIGTDVLSQKMRKAIVAAGIDDRHIREIAGDTVGLYLISLNKGERSFSYWRGQSAAKKLAQDALALANAVDAADIVYFSGITLGILDVASRKTLLNSLGAARASGKTIAFDPNLRPGLWEDDGVMTQTVMQGAAVSNIALPSFEDEARWFGDADPAATAQRYVDAGVGKVIVKNGANDVLYRDGAANGTVAVPPIANVVDTTAAGDSFNAGVLAGLIIGATLPDSIAQASRLAGQVVQHKGALVHIE